MSSTTSGGTITEFSPTGDSIVLHSELSSEPLRYSYSKSTTIVDQNGVQADVSVIKTGMPVQIFYDRDGERMIARRIVVRRTATEPVRVIRRQTTTTTTTGPQ